MKIHTARALQFFASIVFTCIFICNVQAQTTKQAAKPLSTYSGPSFFLEPLPTEICEAASERQWEISLHGKADYCLFVYEDTDEALKLCKKVDCSFTNQRNK